jgi:uncharacterized protein YceH (UPF0502 family)
VLGCLVEKQLTTPQQYPLTLNALTMATNQATNRDPVVALGDDAVLAALDELRGLHLVRVVLPSHGRSVKRYRHVLDEVYGLDAARAGLLAVLLLRGPQTVGELRARTERMVDFPTIGDVQENLAALAEHPDGLARLLSRRPGQKEDRWQQIVAAPWGSDAGAAGIDEGSGGRFDGAPMGEAGDGADGDARSSDRGSDVAEHGSSPGAAAPTEDRRGEPEALRADLDALREVVTALRADLDALREGLGG